MSPPVSSRRDHHANQRSPKLVRPVDDKRREKDKVVVAEKVDDTERKENRTKTRTEDRKRKSDDRERTEPAVVAKKRSETSVAEEKQGKQVAAVARKPAGEEEKIGWFLFSGWIRSA